MFIFILIIIVAVVFGIFDWNREEPSKKPLNIKKNATIEPVVDEVKVEDMYKHFCFDVAGVTFNNGRKSRQTILRKIKFHNDEFKEITSCDLELGEYDGKPSVGIFVNDNQIGFVPARLVDDFLNYFGKYECDVTALDVSGGKGYNYGCEMVVRFNLKSPIVSDK